MGRGALSRSFSVKKFSLPTFNLWNLGLSIIPDNSCSLWAFFEIVGEKKF